MIKTAIFGAIVGGALGFLLPSRAILVRIFLMLVVAAAAVASSAAMEWQSNIYADAERIYRDKQISTREMTAFACGVLAAQHKQALNSGCDKFRELVVQ